MTSAEDGTVGQGALPVSLSLASFAESKEGMAVPWFADLVRGGDTAEGLSEPLRGALCLLTIELAEAQGIERQRDEARQREVEATRQLEEAREREFMLAELRVVLHAKDGDEPELSATSIANRVPDKWAALSQFLDDNDEEFCEWIAETEGADEANALTEVLDTFGASEPRRDRLILELYIGFATAPGPMFRGHEINRATLAQLAQETAEETTAATAVTLNSLFESGVLSRLARLTGASELEPIDGAWQARVGDWINSRPSTHEPNLSWGRAVALLATVDDAARASLDRVAIDAVPRLVAIRSLPASFRTSGSDTVGANIGVVELFERAREQIESELQRALGQEASQFQTSLDLGNALALNTRLAINFFAPPHALELARTFMTLTGAPDEAQSAFSSLYEAMPKARMSQKPNAVASAHRALFRLTVALRPGEKPMFDGRSVDPGSLPTLAFQSVSWSTIEQQIPRMLAKTETKAERHERRTVTHIFESQILTVEIPHSRENTSDVDSRWRSFEDSFTLVVTLVEGEVGRQFSYQLARPSARERVLGILLTAATHEATRQALASAADAASSVARPQFPRAVRFALSRDDAGAHLAIRLLAEFAQARNNNHTGGSEVREPGARPTQTTYRSNSMPTPARAELNRARRVTLTGALLRATIRGAVAFVAAAFGIALIAMIAVIVRFPVDLVPAIIPGAALCGVGVFGWRMHRGLSD